MNHFKKPTRINFALQVNRKNTGFNTDFFEKINPTYNVTVTDTALSVHYQPRSRTRTYNKST